MTMQMPPPDALAQDLWTDGFAPLGPLLPADACLALRTRFDEEGLFRSTVDMARHRFGEGRYRYFAYPLPDRLQTLREQLYARLAPIARAWMAALGMPQDYPDDLAAFLAHCHSRGQTRPTPLMLRYEAGGYNCLHQDLYGDVVFPFQVVIGLSDTGRDFEGGELLLVEQRPRAQSIGRVVPLAQGHGVVVTTRYRPVKGSRGTHRTAMRHGVSTVTHGERFTLGLIFHDAP